MKRFLKNLLLWLLVLVLAAVLYFVVNPAKMQQVSQMLGQVVPTTPTVEKTENTVSVSELMLEKQSVESQLKSLQQEMNEVKAAPTTVMVLFSSLDEALLLEAGGMMDQWGITGLLGISGDHLLNWVEQGVPAHIQERLDAGWEVCLVLEEHSAEKMQSQLEELQLPHAIAAYNVDNRFIDGAALTGNGISIVLDDGVRLWANDDGLWHVPALGSMNSNGLTIYEANRNKGTALVYIAGNLHGDQQYVKENFEALLELIARDRKAGTVQNLQLQPAMTYCRKHEDRIAQYQTGWDQREMELQNQLDEIVVQLGSAGQ